MTLGLNSNGTTCTNADNVKIDCIKEMGKL